MYIYFDVIEYKTFNQLIVLINYSKRPSSIYSAIFFLTKNLSKPLINNFALS